MAVQKQSMPSFASIISVLSVVFYCAGFLRVELELHEHKKRINAIESLAEAKPPSNDPQDPHIINKAPEILSYKHRHSRHVESTKNESEAKRSAETMLIINNFLSDGRLHLCQFKGVPCSSGSPGPPGPPGPRGNRGVRGRRGQKGRTGNKGDKGIMGSPGKSGKQGIMGPVGLKGETGTKGKKGDFGTAGMPGTKGDKGSTGMPGTKGASGMPGAKGATGMPGTKGATGMPGAKGDNGAAGMPGTEGNKGSTGMPGTKGDKGAEGMRGTKGSTGMPGAKGDNGAAGMPGTEGNIGSTGMPGTKGDKGSPGMPGTKGHKGSAGMPGTKGHKGSEGMPGTKGDKGSAGMPGTKGEPGESTILSTGRDCSDLLKSGHTQSGLYSVNPDSRGYFTVYCDMRTDGGGWTVFQRRLDGSVDFYLGWNDYKAGFGQLTAEFWLGNEKIHQLTASRPSSLRVELEDWNGVKAYAKYGKFNIGDEQAQYRIEVGSYSGTAGDALGGAHNNMAFTTKDRDNDRSNSENCAAQRRGPWWYHSCAYANLNGEYLGNKSDLRGARWYQFRSSLSLKFTEMKLRPSS